LDISGHVFGCIWPCIWMYLEMYLDVSGNVFGCTGGPRYSRTFYPRFRLLAAQYSTFLKEPIPLFMYYHWTWYLQFCYSRYLYLRNVSSANNERNLYLDMYLDVSGHVFGKTYGYTYLSRDCRYNRAYLYIHTCTVFVNWYSRWFKPLGCRPFNWIIRLLL